jgi:hypothetical protein
MPALFEPDRVSPKAATKDTHQSEYSGVDTELPAPPGSRRIQCPRDLRGPALGPDSAGRIRLIRFHQTECPPQIRDKLLPHAVPIFRGRSSQDR